MCVRGGEEGLKKMRFHKLWDISLREILNAYLMREKTKYCNVCYRDPDVFQLFSFFVFSCDYW